MIKTRGKKSTTGRLLIQINDSRASDTWEAYSSINYLSIGGRRSLSNFVAILRPSCTVAPALGFSSMVLVDTCGGLLGEDIARELKIASIVMRD